MKKITIYVLTLLLIFVIGFLQNSCEKEEENNTENNKNPPITDFTADATSVTIGTAVQFTDRSTNNPISWSWDFGDGNASSSQNPFHTYLTAGTYTVSLTATNDYGSDTEIKTSFITVVENPNILSDSRDGKKYRIVKIGEQRWMAENLDYNAGSGSWPCGGILYTTDTIPYGRLYNWETACDVCPDGWHLPSDAEWKELEMYLGMSQIDANSIDWRGTDEGSKLKATYGWYNNGNGNNSSGFSAVPGGRYHYLGYFENMYKSSTFWSSTESSGWVYCRNLYFYYNNIRRGEYGTVMGFSVRCVED